MEAEPVMFLFLATILNWVSIKIQSFFAVCNQQEIENTVIQNRESEQEVNSEEVEMVIRRLGVFGEVQVKGLNSDDFSTIFEENEPSFEEVREAFSVFDENCDGFIDARDLQSVLLKLGFSEGVVRLEECEGMIRAHDTNRDGLIDLKEFVRLMESSLY